MNTTKQATKNKVINKLLKGWFAKESVEKMVSKNFDYAYGQYESVKCITECISTLGY